MHAIAEIVKFRDGHGAIAEEKLRHLAEVLSRDGHLGSAFESPLTRLHIHNDRRQIFKGIDENRFATGFQIAHGDIDTSTARRRGAANLVTVDLDVCEDSQIHEGFARQNRAGGITVNLGLQCRGDRNEKLTADGQNCSTGFGATGRKNRRNTWQLISEGIYTLDTGSATVYQRDVTTSAARRQHSRNLLSDQIERGITEFRPTNHHDGIRRDALTFNPHLRSKLGTAARTD